jgi:hypothetical protein
LTIFETWNQNPNFSAIARALGLTKARVHQIVWKAIVSDGCRSDQARAWMAQLDADGYWLNRYEAGFGKSKSTSRRVGIGRSIVDFSQTARAA